MDVTVRIQTLSLSEAGCADVVVVAAAGGDLRTLTSYLSKHPDHVRLTVHVTVVYTGHYNTCDCAVYKYMHNVAVLYTSTCTM